MELIMKNYLRTVTLAAFTWKNEGRAALLFEHIRKTGIQWMVLHFTLVTLCLNFPVMFSMARLAPFELYSRLYGENFLNTLPESAQLTMAENPASGQIDDFNTLMLQNSYGRNVLLPFLCMSFGLVTLIQLVFYTCAVIFLGFSRMNVTPLPLRQRFGLVVYSSTIPVLAASLFGIFLPAVHIIVFYLMVIYFIFQRSRLCPNG